MAVVVSDFHFALDDLLMVLNPRLRLTGQRVLESEEHALPMADLIGGPGIQPAVQLQSLSQ